LYDDVPPFKPLGSVLPAVVRAGGTPITITGTNFFSGASVTVGGVPATTVVFVNSNTLTAVTPANSAGVQNVAVSGPYVSSTGTNILTSTLTNAFTLFWLRPVSDGLTSAMAGNGGRDLELVGGFGCTPI